MSLFFPSPQISHQTPRLPILSHIFLSIPYELAYLSQQEVELLVKSSLASLQFIRGGEQVKLSAAAAAAPSPNWQTHVNGNAESKQPQYLKILQTSPTLIGTYDVLITKLSVAVQSTSSSSPLPPPASSSLDISSSFLLGSKTSPLPPPPPYASSEIDVEESVLLQPRLLNERPPLELDPGLDELCVAFVHWSVLAKGGWFNGDWVLCQGRGELSLPTQYRLIQLQTSSYIFSNDKSSKHGSSHESIYLPPALFSAFNPSTQILLLPTPFSQPPNFPTLASLTLARVPTPISTSLPAQPRVLAGLKSFFNGSDNDNRRRVVGFEGDIICVPVACISFDTDDAPTIPRVGEEDIEDVAFFVITSLSTTAPPAVTEKEEMSFAEEWESRLKKGEFGVVVDKAVTRIVQSGVQNRWLGHRGFGVLAGGYFGVGDSALLASVIASPTPAVSRLLSLLGTTLPSSSSGNQTAVPTAMSILLKSTARGIGKRTCVLAVCKQLGINVVEVDAFDITGDTDVKTEAFLRARFEKSIECAPCVLLVRSIEALEGKGSAGGEAHGEESAMTSVIKSLIAQSATAWKEGGFFVGIVGTTSDPNSLSSGVLGCFGQEVLIEAPIEDHRQATLSYLLSGSSIGADVSVSSLAVQTAALVNQDLVNLVIRAKANGLGRTIDALNSQNLPLLDTLKLTGISIHQSDLSTALDASRSAYSESIGAPKIPNVKWDDIGGLASVKSEILETIQLPLLHPELFSQGLKKRSGLLLFGPPGTGKTLLAKAVATECSLNFFSVKGPELLNMYIGESEANVRRVFQRARDARPCVIFFDELDSVAPKRGNQGDSGGVMDRIVSQLLAELDGMSEGGSSGGGDVFVIGATNRPDLLDPALLRPGRFDRMLYLGVSETHAAQLNIITALTRNFKLDPTLNLADIAEQCPFNYTGADFYALCSDAMLKAMTRKAEEVDKVIDAMNVNGPQAGNSHPHPMTPQYYLSEVASATDVEVLVNLEDFNFALRELIPSVSQSEMEHYRKVQAQYATQKSDGLKGKINGKGKGRA